LALCVKRHDEILSFVPQKYWTLNASVHVNGEPVKLAANRGRMFEKKKAVDVRETLKNHKVAKYDHHLFSFVRLY
jgi:DNA topoisomerase-3